MKKKLCVAFVFAVLLGWSTIGAAVPLDVLVNGGSITVGDKLFSDWGYNLGFASGQTNVDLVGIDVIGMPSDPDNIGLLFVAVPDSISLVGPGNLNFEIYFTVTVQGSDLIKDNSLNIWGWQFSELQFPSAAAIEINEHVVDPTTDQLLGEKYVYVVGDGTQVLMDSATFSPVSSIDVVKTFNIYNEGAGNVALIEFTQHFSQEPGTPPAVPEPATMFLLGIGLLGIAVIGRRNS